MPPAPAGSRARPRLLAWMCATTLVVAASTAHADSTTKLTAEQQRQAAEHNTRAHELYQQGSYREAIAELEAALAIDPNGKDLVFNLGVTHEKLGDIDDALKFFHRYETLDLEPSERARADSYLRRLEGARKEVERPTTEPQPPPSPPPPPPPPAPPEHGRIDVFTIGAGVVAIAGLGVGAGFGIRALTLKPTSGYVTGVDGSYGDLQDETEKAHRDATISDVGFAVGVVGAVATAYLYFARTRDPSTRSTSDATTTPRIEVSGAPLPGGGAMFVGGRF